MKTKNIKNKNVKNDLLDQELENKQEPRIKENMEKNSSSTVATTEFEKKHGRQHNPLGDSHEPGTIPGTGV